ncbi:hypothetical protein AK812_SmicGene23390 [Symbiodinium microadriaticum]|uniref:Uncharacterized protein n=1 Tax=Symbiodinium microadriaticum TaxID=2951 RepID=A0A1Q9DHE9_SYMMI|nr:hypothetical protein AK812_SmicGene23390 [Symbiodinium microadriaticum]CAE7525841.1 unnamed protein product [Symbiodinium microadriaticum]
MKALKAKSKCLRCGAIGHWAGDPECKFPNQKGGKHQGKNRANIAIVAPRQDPDGGLYVRSGNDEDLCSHMVNDLRSKAASAQPSSSMQMEGGDRRFTHGQHKGQTYEEVSRKVEFVKWALLQPTPATDPREFLTWFIKYYAIKEGLDNRPYRETRASLGIPEGTYNPRPRSKGPKKVPPNPPKDRCANCTDFGYAGSSANFVRKTCRDCGNVSQERREHVYTVAVSEKLLEATEQAVPIIQALTADDATADLNQEAVEQLMAVFQDRVTQAMAQEERIHPAALHEWLRLREAVASVMEQSPTSPAWGFVPTALGARGRSPGKHKGKGKGKAKAKGKPQAPEQQSETTAEPEFYRISDPLGADSFVGSQFPELDADYRVAADEEPDSITVLDSATDPANKLRVATWLAENSSVGVPGPDSGKLIIWWKRGKGALRAPCKPLGAAQRRMVPRVRYRMQLDEILENLSYAWSDHQQGSADENRKGPSKGLRNVRDQSEDEILSERAWYNRTLIEDVEEDEGFPVLQAGSQGEIDSYSIVSAASGVASSSMHAEVYPGPAASVIGDAALDKAFRHMPVTNILHLWWETPMVFG